MKITSLSEYIKQVALIKNTWGEQPIWFRGESEFGRKLIPRIAQYDAVQENILNQAFRRKAAAFPGSPRHDETDKWLFWAQHHGLPTRLLDFSESSLVALYFSLAKLREKPEFVVHVLNPHMLNILAFKEIGSSGLDRAYPLTISIPSLSNAYENIALAWESRNATRRIDLPIAVPSPYIDARMVAQKSCYLIFGKSMDDLETQLGAQAACVIKKIHIDETDRNSILSDLRTSGISQSSIMPDLDGVAADITSSLDVGMA